ncbi:MAG TPA: DUF1684 domain-containing protein [Bryobacteraceae bacterium]|nr:DUF1684 domain-containing protein [Bryobacteraceae bacterium]
MSRPAFVAAPLFLLLLNAPAGTQYQTAIEQWRAHREASLKADGGWLTVAGLFWLKEGANTAGTDPSCDIVLPRGPAKAGFFEFHDGKTTFRPASGAAMELKSDSEGEPDQVKLDSLTMFVIHRGQRYGIRMKDTASKFRKEFTGLHWFPVNESYRVTAKFVPNPPGKTIAVPNILGETEQEPSPGYVLFTLNGQSLRLDPVVEGKELFFIFHDQTSGKKTYPPGRFLYSDFPKDGKVELDFNKAYNPPCAFTPFATCPLPPKQNRLPVRIEAGELNYGHH